MSVPSPLLDTDDVKNFVPAKPALVQKSHKESYLALSPLRPELNQCGRNILITGASAGIGFAIARAYAEASSSRIIMTGRRKDVLQHAASVLSSDFPKTEFIVWVCDVGSVTDSAALWTGLRNDGIFIDVLVLNAAKFHDQKSILETELGTTWSLYETNVRTILDFSQRLQVQEESADRQKVAYTYTHHIK
jgi:short-subunit dehydrogenase